MNDTEFMNTELMDQLIEEVENIEQKDIVEENNIEEKNIDKTIIEPKKIPEFIRVIFLKDFCISTKGFNKSFRRGQKILIPFWLYIQYENKYIFKKG